MEDFAGILDADELHLVKVLTKDVKRAACIGETTGRRST